jgi:hypothetical protein
VASNPPHRQANVAGAARMQRERNPGLRGAKEDPARRFAPFGLPVAISQA